MIRSVLISTYRQEEGGFWGLIDKSDGRFIAINLPEQLKIEGKETRVSYKKRVDIMGFNMWGEYIELLSFHS